VEHFDDISPLSLGNRPAGEIPKKFAQHGILRTLQDQLLTGSSNLHRPAPGKLSFVIGRRADAEQVDLQNRGR
jgi:hypothetical protein